MLLLFLLVHHVLAKDFPKQTNYITKRIDSCPDVGYFFRRELGKSAHPGPCYLCFCRENSTAVCWPRDNKRCDVEHYHHHGVGKRDARFRRSPAGLSDIFFRDAARDVFNKQIPAVCLPFQSSYNVGCPPADWCVGCTVCDCDAHGHWDCHTLSFCPEKPTKKPKKEYHRGKPYKGKFYKQRPKPTKRTDSITSADKSARTAKVIKSSPVKKQTKKIQVAPLKKGPQVTRNQPAKRSPQIKKTPTRKRSTQILRNSSGKRSQEIKKTAVVKRNQVVTKNTVKKRSSIKKKGMPTKISTGIKTAKKTAPLKKNPPARNAPLKKRSSAMKVSAAQKNKLSKRSPPAQRAMPREIKLTSRPVIVKSKVMPPKITEDPKKNLVTTTTKPNISPDLTPEILGKRLVRQFMSVLQKPVNTEDSLTNKPVKVTAKQTTTPTIPPMDENVGQEVVNTFMSAFQNILKRNIQQRVDSARKRTKRQDVNLGSIELLNEINIMDRFKRSVNSASLIKNDTSSPISPNVVITESPNTSNVSAYNFYTYSDDIIRNTTSNNEETFGYSDDSLSKTSTAKRSIPSTNQYNATDRSIPNPNQYNTSDILLSTQTTFNYSDITSLTTLPMSQIENKTSTEPNLIPVDNLNDANDLKFNKWSQVNIIRDKDQILKIASDVNKSSPLAKYSDQTTEFNKKLHSFKLARKIAMVKKKYKLRKVVSTLNNKTRKIEKISLNPFKALYVKTKKNGTKAHGFSTFVKNAMNGFGKRNVTRRTKASKYKIIKYLQRIFKKMFSKGKHEKGKMNDRSKLISLNKDSVLETLCESFGPCHINRESKVVLQTKIEDLSKETNRMLETIKIIKGLLKLVDIAKYDRNLQNGTEKIKPNFKSDIKKLSAILKGTYDNNENSDRLTQTQLTHIDYIKQNSQMFIQTTGKFARILNEIIDIIGTTNKKNEKDKIRRISRFAITEEAPKPKPPVTNAPFETMKDLLLKYNLLQNKFINRMYKVLANIQMLPVKTTPKPVRLTEKTSNRTAEIHTYTKNIIKNLRKLKSLAQTLSSGRKRRDLRDNDSMEYLLVLMEYLLKQNDPLDAAPVNDGIDLLIEAIKHAPDIKQVKKKILDSKSMRVSNSTDYVNSTEMNASSEDSASDRIKNLKTDKLASNSDDTKENAIEESVDNDSEEYNKFMANRRVEVKSTTEVEYYRNNEVVKLTTEKPVEETTKSFVPITPPIGIYTQAFNDENPSDVNIIEKAAISGYKENSDMKIDVFDVDNAEVTVVGGTTTTESETKSELPTSTTTSPVTNAQILFVDGKVRHYDKYQDDISASQSADKKYMDWLDESFEEEVKKENNATEAVKRRAIGAPQPKKGLENISSFSKESNENKMKKINSEELTYKKEMNLLNSLDYGTIKSESDDSDTREISEDKYNEETFAEDFL